MCQVADFTDTVALAAYAPVDCAVPHRVETVHVGALPAGRAAAPATGSAELRGAFAECDTRAAGYLGDDWRAGRLRLAVALPTTPGWAAGARWFRCDLSEVDTAEAAATVVTRTGSLRDALKGPSPLRLGCQRAKRGRGAGVQVLVPVECSAVHEAEFVGAWKAPIGRTRRRTSTGCRCTPAAVPCWAVTWACLTTPTCGSAAAWWYVRPVRAGGGSATGGPLLPLVERPDGDRLAEGGGPAALPVRTK